METNSSNELHESSEGNNPAGLKKEEIKKELNSMIEKMTGMKVDPQTNFMDLGGNSIVAAQMVGELNQHYSIELQISKLLETENIGGFIDYVVLEVLNRKTEQNSHIGKLQPGTDNNQKGPKKWPLTSDQERIWFMDQLKPGNPAFNLYLAIKLKGNLHLDKLNKSHEALLKKHDLLRARITVEDGKVFQIIGDVKTGTIPVEEIKEKDIESKLNIEASKGMNIFEEDLFKVKLFRIKENEHILFLNIHHIISDAWSAGIMLADILKFYSQLAAGKDMEPAVMKSNYYDFIKYQNTVIEKKQNEQLEYWKNTLKNIPTQIALPYDLERPKVLTYKAGHIRFDLSDETVQAMKKLSGETKITIFNYLYSAFAALLYISSDQSDFVVGLPIANRKLPDFNGIIGFFANTLVVKNHLSRTMDLPSIIKQNQDMSHKAFDNSDLPFMNIVRNVSHNHEPNINPLFQVMFSMMQFPEYPKIEELSIEYLELFSGFSDYDIFLRMEVSNQTIKGSFDYSMDLFTEDTANAIVKGYLSLLDQILKKPDMKISEFIIPEDLKKTIENYKKRNYKQQIVISSTFSDQPVKDIVSFWMNKLKLSSNIELADYNQVFNQLLDPSQLMLTNKDGVNVILVRLEDWIRYQDQTGEGSNGKDKLTGICDDFVRALKKAAEVSSVPMIAGILPSRQNNGLVPGDVLDSLQENIIKNVSRIKNIYLIKPEDISALYPVKEIFDEVADKAGHMPFTNEYYKAAGTAVSRKIYAIKKHPYKVIILDCDNTLWKGVIGEDGIEKIEIDQARMEFQKLMAGQQENGVLLCLVSKNEEPDVVKVFQQKTGMVLKLDQIALIKANWESKSENIKKIADELNLSLDSFIFVDDNPMECAEVASVYPEVLTIQFPQEAEEIINLINHGWFWDHLKITEEDKARTKMYKEEAMRNKEIEKHITFEEFYNSLQMKIEINEIKNEDVPRVSQMTQRTNQFNSTTVRRTESEVMEYTGGKQNKCLTISVSDRFGSYGMVGAMFYTISGPLKVDSVILSCRTLGKGVEHAMMNKIAEIADENKINEIIIPFVESSKNTPMHNFLESIPYIKFEKKDGGIDYYYAAAQMKKLNYDPSSYNKEKAGGNKKEINRKNNERFDNELLLDILANYSDIGKIEIKSKSLREPSSSISEPENDVQKKIVSLFKEVLNINQIGIDDNFFELGGYSIQLVQLLSKIQKEFDRSLVITDLFQYTNIRKLADYLTKGETNDALREIKEKAELQRKRVMALRK